MKQKSHLWHIFGNTCETKISHSEINLHSLRWKSSKKGIFGKKSGGQICLLMFFTCYMISNFQDKFLDTSYMIYVYTKPSTLGTQDLFI